MKRGPISYYRTVYHIILNNCLIPWLNSSTEQYKSHGHDMISILMLKMRDECVPEPFYKPLKIFFQYEKFQNKLKKANII